MQKQRGCLIVLTTIRAHQRSFILGISFLIPVLLMGGYFAYRQMAPFGSSSLLTVDLGQQYVDFFAYLRSSLLHHPSSFFYSFAKGLGGEMWGTDAYYLFSPLNLLLVFFPGRFLTSGIMLILLLRYGLAGLSFAWLLDKTGWQKGPRIWAFSTAYALNGWMIANQLNMIWLDALVILPLIIWGLLKLFYHQRPGCYIFWLAVMMIDNYYMAWMICLFSLLLFCWLLPEAANWRARGWAALRYGLSSLAAAGIAAVTLLPTIYALLQSKGTYTEQVIHSHFEYFPFKMLAKLVPGSFNFDQMPSGQPNIYIGMLLLMAAFLYFFNRQVTVWRRLVALGVTLFFLLSFCYEPLDLLWHAGQFPVWYPYRFSFLFCCWCIILAAQTLQRNFRPRYWQLALLLLITGAVFAYVSQLKLSYLNASQRWIGLGFALISISCLAIPRKDAPRLYDLLLICLVICDVATSAFTSLNNLAYVSQGEFAQYTTQLDQATKKLRQHDRGLYRVAKTFTRTKDDPFQGDFNSGDHFGSTLEPAIPNFMGAIGQPAGDGFVTYANGTQVTDALLGFKYTLAKQNWAATALPPSGYRPDWRQLPITATTANIVARHNSDSLPFAFGASSEILQLPHTTLDPVSYQSQIMQALAGRPVNKQLFQVQNFNSVQFNNVQTSKQITGTIFKKRDFLKPASIRLTFIPSTNDSYYLTVGPSVKDDATLSINNKAFAQSSNYRDTVVINLAHRQKGRPVTITFRLKKMSAWLQNVSVYQLNQRSFDASLQALKQSPLKVSHHSSSSITGTVDLKRQQSVLMTTIPAARGWHAIVDDRPAATKTVLGTFMAIPMAPGHHQVKLFYRPPFLILGLVTSLLTSGGTWLILRYQSRRRR
ncbi:YfhO family protein [Limosilactobacillus antri]|uniref:Bacterial membrane protein YfhO n=1 Tax=Limosilactobacillus antri DSM 16041 TaxID=525309 RepID=C8P987_9LACO|nr:bacterial membrane protein YfhO [Limosilactobacillus antri DSM 16041]